MTPREHAAFTAGIETARQMALTAAISLEVRGDAQELRQQAAVAALQGLAEGLRSLTIFESAPEQGADAMPVSLNTRCRRLMAGLDPLTGAPQS